MSYDTKTMSAEYAGNKRLSFEFTGSKQEGDSPHIMNAYFVCNEIPNLQIKETWFYRDGQSSYPGKWDAITGPVARGPVANGGSQPKRVKPAAKKPAAKKPAAKKPAAKKP